jgi:ATP-dependent Lon protease
MAAEYPVAMNYVEFMLDLPWAEYTVDDFDLKRAKKILDQDHFGLDKVKNRILEYLAVLKLKQDMKGPILCLYGPPGVGKTSLGKSIAKALQRKYVRMSLGGVHDEAEIRGHRKTYVGAMPGKILQHIKKSQSSNPVFILDEIDKVKSDFRGDPSSALLEVLDPEQNNTFGDNYLEVEYDLSKVLFIATANSLDTIHPALRDRMEIIEVTGYTQEEKIEIAIKHLIPKQLKDHGLKNADAKFSRAAIAKVINQYTRESGVRNLERKIGTLARSIAKSVALEEPFDKTVSEETVRKVLGAEIFDEELYQGNDIAGVVTGLAWTQVGGEILFVESSLNKGRGALTISGQLGDVMKESAVAALSYLKSNAEDLLLDHKVFQQYDLHIHVPAGAVPKDGPSAGITMFTSLASIYTQRKVKAKLAMTGEITLRGKVLPVGGIKEKILAAKRSGIREIVLSAKNKRDIDEIEKQYLKGLTFHYVETVDQVLDVALLKEKVKDQMKFVFSEHPKDTGTPGIQLV